MLVIAAASVSVSAQQNDADVSGRAKEDLPKGIVETLAKGRIEREKKDFAELLARGEEAAKLSLEVDNSFAQNKQLTAEDRKKLERLEKISKKIREELGASDEAEDDVKVSSTSDAVDKLKDLSAKLAEELKKTTRYTISAVAVQSSNAVLKIVRFIRTGKN